MLTKIFIALIGIVMSGCATAAHKRDTRWDRDFTYIKIIRQTFEKSASLHFDCNGYKTSSSGSGGSDTGQRTFNWLEQVQCYIEDPDTSDQQKAELRNRVVESFVTLVNHIYGDFEHDSVLSREGVSAGLDSANLGLTAASAVFGGTSLGAVSTATQGFQHSIDKNFYNSETAFVINGKMQALRLEQLTRIREREALPVNCKLDEHDSSAQTNISSTQKKDSSTEGKGSQPRCYTLSEAMNDVQDLFYAGTVHRALQDIGNQTSAQTNQAQNKLDTLRGENIPVSPNITRTQEKAPGPAPSPSPTATPQATPPPF